MPRPWQIARSERFADLLLAVYNPPMRIYIALALLLSVAAPAFADESPAPVTAPLSLLPSAAVTSPVDDVKTRLSFIRSELEARDRYAAYWWWGFTSIYAIGTIGQGVLYVATPDQRVRNDALVGGVTSALGVIGMLIVPAPKGGTAAQVDRAFARTDWTDEQKLAVAETVLMDTAAKEAESHHWFQYVQGAAVGVAAGAVMWWVYDQPSSAGIKLATTILFGTPRTVFTPTGAEDAWETYRARYNPAVAGLRRDPEVTWSVVAGPSQVGVQWRF